jgi:Ca2+-binding RTX toxin-like protein
VVACNGANGNDLVVVLAQADLAGGESYTGGTGVDTLLLATASAINLSSVTINSDVETLQATGAVSLTAAQLGNFSTVAAGAVTVTTAGAIDLAGANVVVGTITLNAGGNALNLNGTTASYTVVGGNGADTVVGALQADSIGTGAGNDSLSGGGGDDTLTGGTGIVTVNGGSGDDRFVILAQNHLGAGESYDGGAGFDTLDLQTGAAVNLSAVTIGATIEALQSGGAVSLTAAQLGGFSFITTTGAITLTGAGIADLAGTGVFTAAFNLSGAGNTLDLGGAVLAGYTVNGGAAADSVIGGEKGDLLNGAGGNDTLLGGGGSNTLNGDDGNDLLTAGTGGDVLTGGAGVDTVHGDAGSDVLVILDQADLAVGEIYDGGIGDDLLDVELAGAIDLSAVTITGVERLAAGGNVSLTAAQLDGFATIATSPASAIILTTGGVVDLSGASVFAGSIVLNAAGNNLSLTDTDSSYVVNGGNGGDTVIGGGFADAINTGGGNDRIDGGAGSDTVTGGGGIDTVGGGTGDDRLVILGQGNLGAGEIYDGSIGRDTLDLQTAAAIDLSAVSVTSIEVLHSGGAVSLTAAQLDAFSTISTGTITLTGTGVVDLSGANVFTTAFNLFTFGNTLDLTDVVSSAFTVNGNAAADTVIGGDLGDTLNGGGSNDVITGHAGDDVMDGGAATDTFTYDAQFLNTLDVDAGASDTILNGVGDRIDFANAVEDDLFIGGTALDSLVANTALGSAFAPGTNIILAGGFLEIDLNGNQSFDAGTDFRIALPGVGAATYNAALDLFVLT